MPGRGVAESAPRPAALWIAGCNLTVRYLQSDSGPTGLLAIRASRREGPNGNGTGPWRHRAHSKARDPARSGRRRRDGLRLFVEGSEQRDHDDGRREREHPDRRGRLDRLELDADHRQGQRRQQQHLLPSGARRLGGVPEQQQHRHQHPADLKKLYSNLKSTLDDAESIAPSTIKPDFQTFVTAFTPILNTLAQYNYDFSKIPPSAYAGFQGMDTPAIKAASAHIEQYVEQVCHVSPTSTP